MCGTFTQTAAVETVGAQIMNMHQDISKLRGENILIT